jgi:hypothetical protein
MCANVCKCEHSNCGDVPSRGTVGCGEALAEARASLAARNQQLQLAADELEWLRELAQVCVGVLNSCDVVASSRYM